MIISRIGGKSLPIVPISDSLIDPKTRMLGKVKMQEEIEQWCSTELRGDFHLSYASISSRKEYDKSYQIVFERETDAIMFKMRWF